MTIYTIQNPTTFISHDDNRPYERLKAKLQKLRNLVGYATRSQRRSVSHKPRVFTDQFMIDPVIGPEIQRIFR